MLIRIKYFEKRNYLNAEHYIVMIQYLISSFTLIKMKSFWIPNFKRTLASISGLFVSAFVENNLTRDWLVTKVREQTVIRDSLSLEFEFPVMCIEILRKVRLQRI